MEFGNLGLRNSEFVDLKKVNDFGVDNTKQVHYRVQGTLNGV